MPILSMPVQREITEVSGSSSEDCGEVEWLYPFQWPFSVVTSQMPFCGSSDCWCWLSPCLKRHCQENPLEKEGKPKATATPKGKADKSKGAAKTKGLDKAKVTAKAKAAKAKAAPKSSSSKSKAKKCDEETQQEVGEARGEELVLKRPSAMRRPSANPKQKSRRVSPEKDAKAAEDKISNPYFYNNLNQWGIKVNGKQKVSVQCSDHSKKEYNQTWFQLLTSRSCILAPHRLETQSCQKRRPRRSSSLSSKLVMYFNYNFHV